jgi:hypothetical protein
MFEMPQTIIRNIGTVKRQVFKAVQSIQPHDRFIGDLIAHDPQPLKACQTRNSRHHFVAGVIEISVNDFVKKVNSKPVPQPVPHRLLWLIVVRLVQSFDLKIVPNQATGFEDCSDILALPFRSAPLVCEPSQ